MKFQLTMAAAMLIATLANSCTATTKQEEPKKSENEFVSTNKPEWSRSAVIYEVNWRQFTNDSKISSFSENLPYLKELGVDILWFMPVNPISEVNRKGELGSYYAVQNYTVLNPELGTIDDFKAMVQKAHSLDMKVIIDWVANHTGCDNVWLTEHPDWYMRDSKGELISQYDWTDTYKLDYSNQELRSAMKEAMKFWLTECEIDGFRCDVAFLLPTDFWQEARKELEAVKPIFMLAEANKYELTDGAFDMLYNWPQLFLFDEICKGEKTIATLDTVLQTEADSTAKDSYYMNHITNHDRNSWDGTEFERYGNADAVKAFAALTYVLPGMPLIYTGQEVGFDHRYEFFVKDTPATLEKNEWWQFYNGLNNLKHTQKSLKAGVEGGAAKKYKTDADDMVYVYERVLADESTLYVGNLSGDHVTFSFADAKPEGEYVNWFTGETVDFADTDTRVMEPWEFAIFTKNK